MSTFTPYQVDYSVKNASKTFGFSKKRVSFKFGLANPDAVASGQTGANCRGSEHEIIFIWSLNSGKRQILADGKDVHFSESGQNGWTTDQVFQHQFQLRVPGYDQPLRCHLISQPKNPDVPSSKPFDLRVQGISYFAFCKIYELGTARMHERTMRMSGGNSGRGYYGGSPSRGCAAEDDPYTTPEERKAIAAAKLASLKDFEQQRRGPPGGSASGAGSAGSMNRNEDNLINLLDDPAPVPAAAGGPGMPSHYMSSMTMDPALMGGPAPPPPAPAPATYPQQPYSNYSLGGPPPAPAPNAFDPMAFAGPAPAAAAPMGSYGQPPPAYGQPPAAPPAGSYGQPPPAASYGQPPPAPESAYGQPPAAPYGQPPAPASYGQPPAQAATSAYGQPPPAYGQPPPPQQQQQQQQFGNYYQAPPPVSAPGFANGNGGMKSPSNETYVTYGSAPSFAQPPSQQAPPPAASYPPQQQQPYGYPPQY